MKDVVENELIEIQAKVVIEELLLRRHTLLQIQRVMASHELRLSRGEVTAFVRKIKEEWELAAGDKRAERREIQIRSLENLYRTAFVEKKYSVCLGVERLLAEIFGTMAPKNVHVTTPMGSSTDDEFEDKSELELDYFSTHGRWPEDEARH